MYIYIYTVNFYSVALYFTLCINTRVYWVVYHIYTESTVQIWEETTEDTTVLLQAYI